MITILSINRRPFFAPTIVAMLLSISAINAAPAPAPVVQSLSVSNEIVTLSWTHPTARAFEIGSGCPSRAIANSLWTEPVVFEKASVAFTYSWRFPHYTNAGAGFAVRAVSASSTNLTEWSNELRLPPVSAQSSGPPDPRDPRTWTTRETLRQANTLGATTVAAEPGKELVLTWNYSGAITPNHYFRVWRSLDLKTWTLAETLPTSVVAGWNVPAGKSGFYLVSSTENDTNLWHTITNLVMDP